MWWRVAGFVSQLGASAEDCLWVVAVAELVFCMVAIYPRSSLSFKSSASPLLQMVAFKLLAVDGLRIAAEVSSGILPCWVNVSRRRVRLLGTCGSPHPHMLACFCICVWTRVPRWRDHAVVPRGEWSHSSTR